MSRWLVNLLDRLYKVLARNDSPEAVDLIFVIAGRMDRKQYGIELYRAGFAPRLLLSIGRFEVSKMSALDFGAQDELITLRNRTAPGERHFFCEMRASGVKIDKISLRRWNTYGELLGLRECLTCNDVRSLIIVSTDIHLRRIALTFEKVFREMPIKVLYCPVPDAYGSVRNGSWWRRPKDRRFVTAEAMKLVGYWIILSMPDWAVQKLMRLRKK